MADRDNNLGNTGNSGSSSDQIGDESLGSDRSQSGSSSTDSSDLGSSSNRGGSSSSTSRDRGNVSGDELGGAGEGGMSGSSSQQDEQSDESSSRTGGSSNTSDEDLGRGAALRVSFPRGAGAGRRRDRSGGSARRPGPRDPRGTWRRRGLSGR